MNAVSPPCSVRSGAAPGEDCLPWLCSKPEAPQLQSPPHFPGPRNPEPAQPTATGSPGEGKTTFSHKPVASPFPRQGQGRSWSRNSALPSPPWQGCLCPHTYCPTAGLGMRLSPANPMGWGSQRLHLPQLGHPGAAAVPLSLCHSVSPGQRG